MFVNSLFKLSYNTFLLQDHTHIGVTLDAPFLSFVFVARLAAHTPGDAPLVFELGQCLLVLA